MILLCKLLREILFVVAEKQKINILNNHFRFLKVTSGFSNQFAEEKVAGKGLFLFLEETKFTLEAY